MGRESDGWLHLLDDLSLVDRRSNDPGHIPLRFRVLIHARDVEGMTWRQCGDLIGTTSQGAQASYRQWSSKDCCEHHRLHPDDADPS